LIQTRAVAEMSESSGPTTGIWSNETGYNWEGKNSNSDPRFGTLSCTHDFGKTINWTIKAGRDFSRDFPSDSSAVILNESAVKLIGAKDIIGKTITNDNEIFHVIGVVEDMVMESPYETIRPIIFSLNYRWSRVTNIRLNTDVPVSEAIAKVEAVFKKLSPDNIFEFRFVDKEYDAKFSSENRVSQIARLFAVLAIFIACLGLLGLSTFVAEQRQKEICIRKVLGASVVGITTLLSKDFLKLVFLSIIIASPTAYYFASRWLQNFAYRTEINWWVFTLAGVAASAIALATVSYQSIKVAISNPVDSLRSE
jgi:ABC-type antimicrobial peptide transport system permease subunit